jgi:hypothetical protein
VFKLKNVQIGEKIEYRKTEEKKKKKRDPVLHRRSRGQSELAGALRAREKKD